MNSISRMANFFASIVIGVSLAGIALLFIVLGFTFLPVVGILIAFPVLRFSAYFLTHTSSADHTVKQTVTVHEEAPYCPLPYQLQH